MLHKEYSLKIMEYVFINFEGKNVGPKLNFSTHKKFVKFKFIHDGVTIFITQTFELF